MPLEARQRIAAALRGPRGITFSAERRQEMSDARKGKKLAADNPYWRGGRYRESRSGYVLVYITNDHPLVCMRTTATRPYVLEHRLVMAQRIGRPLRPEEVVHHKLECEGGSGRNDDNRIENLLLFACHGDHMRHHASLRSPAELLAISRKKAHTRATRRQPT